MKSYILSVILSISQLSTVIGQNTYYVSSVGNDVNDGRSTISPFKTLDKVNTLTLQPGDKVLLRRGDTFRGMLTVQQSGNTANPISVDAYGTGAKPVIAGSAPITGWSSVGTNLWQTTCILCGATITGLYNGNTALPLGRYPNLSDPNKGYLTIQSHTGKNQFVSQQNLPADFTGGEVVYRPVRWILNRAAITQQSGNTLNIDNSSSTYDLQDGWGYFIQNHPATLDQNGEWYFNAITKTIRLFSTTNPNSLSIAATVYSKCMNVINTSNVTVSNLTLTQSLNFGFYVANTSNLTIRGIDVTNSGENGIEIDGTGTNIDVLNSTVDQANNNGVNLQAYTNITFRGNIIRQIGMIPGRGKSGDGQYRGFDASATTNLLIDSNRLDSIGYTGISFSTQTFGLTIQKNVISNFCMTKSDGGGIYTWNGVQQTMNNIKILSNIIYNAFPSKEGTSSNSTSSFSGSNGIYLDQCSQNITVNDNTVYNCYGIGIFLISVTNITVRRNTSFNNGESQLVLTKSAGLCSPRNNVIKRNVLVSKSTTATVARYESDQNDLSQYGDIDSNYYARPLDDVVKIGISFPNVNAPYSLKDWQNVSGKDINSVESPVTYAGFKTNALNEPNRIGNSTFNTDVLEWYPQSPYYNNGKIAWDNTNKLDGGSMQVYFDPPSGFFGSFAIVFHSAYSIASGRNYVLRFDAVASANGKAVQTFIRKRFGSDELTLRVGAMVGTTRKHYDVAFTATKDEPDAVVIFQTREDGQSVWLDNISFQEASITRDNPDSLLRIVYSTSSTDSLISLDGNYRDVRNQLYTRQIRLAPFTSVVLFRDTTSAVDLRLTLQADREINRLNTPFTLRVRVRNANTTPGASSTATANWVCRLPPNVAFVSGTGVTNTNGTVAGTVGPLNAQTEVITPFQVQLTAPGSYQFAAEILTASRLDPSSTPNSGTADGEDDASTVTVRTANTVLALYVSPNPNQRASSAVISNQPAPVSGQADLMLAMSADRRLLTVNQIVTVSVTVTNIGAGNVTSVQVKNTLPLGFVFVDGSNWSSDGQTQNGQAILSGNFGAIAAGTSVTLLFRARSTTSGSFINVGQITTSTIADPDSTPGNGTTNGEDDRAQVDIRVR